MALNPLTNLRRALEVYEAGQPAREALFQAAQEAQTHVRYMTIMDKYDARMEAAEKAVQYAFYLDTKDINSERDCYLLDLAVLQSFLPPVEKVA